MTFLVMLASLVAERFLSPRYQNLRRARWFERYFEWHQALPVASTLRSGVPGVITLLLPPLLVLYLLQATLTGSLAGLPETALAALVLLYCLGPTDLDAQVRTIQEASKSGDEEGTRRLVAELLAQARGTDASDSATGLAEAVLVLANSRWFGVLFWFLLLGPLGAAGYRLSFLVREFGRAHSRPSLVQPSEGLMAALDWLPVRAMALGFALAGCFEQAREGWRNCTAERQPGATDPILTCVGISALSPWYRSTQDAPEALALLQPALGLVWRTLILWVALVGLMAVSGWLL